MKHLVVQIDKQSVRGSLMVFLVPNLYFCFLYYKYSIL